MQDRDHSIGGRGGRPGSQLLDESEEAGLGIRGRAHGVPGVDEDHS